MQNNAQEEMQSVFEHYKDSYRTEWVPNEDFALEGDAKYYEKSPCLIIYFKDGKYAILADVDEVELFKRSKLFKGKWTSVTHNHPDGDFTEDGSEIIRCIDNLIDMAT